MAKVKYQSVVRTATIPAPIGGLNARDALADMKPTDAPVLENWFPTPTSVNMRNGYVNFVTGLPGWVETLMHYSGYTVKKLFGISNGSIYDTSTSGAVGAAVVTGLSNSRWQHANFGTPGDQFLVLCNGTDAVRNYSTSTGWTSPTITASGTSSADFIHVNVYANRLWFTEKNTMKIWYLPVDSIAGTAASINFGSLFRLGGYLNAMATWSVSTVNGPQNLAAFISSEGEIAIYQGVDPTTAAGFTLVGIFRIGRPIGRRCFLKVGPDVIVICADGAFPLSKALETDRAVTNASLSDKIVNLINNDVAMYAGNFGWELQLFPIGNKLIVNVPQTENSSQYQYVMNTINNSWTKFTGWNAATFEFFNDSLYFGGNLVVAQCDIGNSDNGAAINVDGKTAFNYLGARGRIKQVKMARPTFLADAQFSPSLELNVDYADNLPQSPGNFVNSTNNAWDTSPWDVTPWGGGQQVIKKWQTVNGVGTAISLRVRAAAIGINISWQSNDLAYELGGVL